jgi:hypothetical protein
VNSRKLSTIELKIGCAHPPQRGGGE